MLITGECFCGSIRYELGQAPSFAQSCHCSRCRKAFSGQASATAFIDSEHFRWIAGEELLTSYLNKQGLGLQFCKRRGSSLCGVSHGKVICVFLGCVNGDPPVAIEQHIYVESKASWEILPEGIVQYPGAPPERSA